MTTKLTRRSLLQSTAILGAGTLLGQPLLRPLPAAAQATTKKGKLVVVFLRGAADHLSLTIPLDDADYHDARPTIAIAADDALPLDDRFGFHPAMPRLYERYKSGQLAPVVAVGNPAANRSHFMAQDLFERGSDGEDSIGDGWLARYLSATATADDSALRAVTVGANVDDSLLGYKALGMLSLRSFGLAGAGDFADDLAAAMGLAYGGDSAIDGFAQQALDAVGVVAELPASRERNRTVAAFEDIATLLDADLGTEIVTVSVDGWDTHDRMGTATEGDMARQLGILDNTLGGLADSLDDRGINDVTTLVVTEFGRRVAENGSGGCDHGWGSAALVLGPSVVGNRVHGEWAGLSADVLSDTRGDVPMTTDYRDLLGDAVGAALGGDGAVVFPGLERRPVGVFA